MKRHNSMTALCRGLSAAVLMGVLLSFIGNFTHDEYTEWSRIFRGVFKIFLFVFMVVFEVFQTPAIAKCFSFMYCFFGRGFFYIFLGFSTMEYPTVSVAGGILIIIVGIIYLLLYFTKNGREPEYMSYNQFLRFNGGIAHEVPAAMPQAPHNEPQLPVYSESSLPPKIVTNK